MLVQTFGRLRAESADRRAVRFERVYDYRPEELWAAITEPEQLSGWLGQAKLEADGGTISFGEAEVATLRLRKLEPGKLVEYDWSFPNEPLSVLRLELEPRGEGTLLTLDHRRLAAEDVVDYGAGWHAHLDALELQLRGETHDWPKLFEELRPGYQHRSAELPDDARLGSVRVEGQRRGVRYERLLAASVEEVWRALTDPDRLGIWMDGEATVEPRRGGLFELRWGDDNRWRGTVRVWDPPHVFEVTWHEGEDASVVRFELEEAEGATRLVLDHRALPVSETISVGAGWHSHLDWLEAYLADSDFDFWPRFRELGPTYTDLAAAL